MLSEKYPGQAYFWQHNKNIRKAEEAAMPIVATKQSFFEQLTQSIYLDRVLKILGVIVFVLAFLASWHGIPVLYRFLMVIAIVMWFVGARFTKIYR